MCDAAGHWDVRLSLAIAKADVQVVRCWAALALEFGAEVACCRLGLTAETDAVDALARRRLGDAAKLEADFALASRWQMIAAVPGKTAATAPRREAMRLQWDVALARPFLIYVLS